MDQAKQLYTKGMELQKTGNYSEAVKCFYAAVVLDESYQSAWFQKGYCEDELKEYKKAVQSYDQAIQLDPTCSAWTDKGLALRRLGQNQEALDCYNNAIKLNPHDHISWNNKGYALRSLGRYQEALDCYDHAIQLNKNYSFALNGKGSSLYNLNRYEEALDQSYLLEILLFLSYNQAIAIQKKVLYYNNKGNVLQKLHRDKEALKSYQQALQLEPQDIDAQNFIKDIQEQVNLFEESKIQEYKQTNQLISNLTQSEQTEITKQFIGKFIEDQAFLWIGKLSTLQNQYKEEVCNYQKDILSFLISSNEANQIQITKYNAKSGGFSQIHFVAIKEQSLGENEPDSSLIALLREITILTVCNNQHIQKLIGVYFNSQRLQVWTVHPQYYLNLYEVLFGGEKFFIPKKDVICCQLFEALTYIHSIGLIHMDLKPTNIVFKTSSFKKIILLDFGISKIERKNQNTNIIAINYHYCPPEIQDNNQSQVSTKSDIFSAGIVLYELITERRAFMKYLQEGGIAIYQLIHNPKFDFFRENQLTGNQQLDKLIGDCVQYNPSNRPTAAEALKRIKMIKL